MTSGCSAAWQRASFGTKRSWVQIPPPRQLSSRPEGPCRIGEDPLALLSVPRRGQRWRSLEDAVHHHDAGLEHGPDLLPVDPAKGSAHARQAISGRRGTPPTGAAGRAVEFPGNSGRLVGIHPIRATTVRHIRLPRRRRPAVPVRSVLVPRHTGVLPGPRASSRSWTRRATTITSCRFTASWCTSRHQRWQPWGTSTPGSSTIQGTMSTSGRKLSPRGNLGSHPGARPCEGRGLPRACLGGVPLMRPAGRRPAEHHAEYRGRSHSPRFSLSPGQQISAYVVFQAGDVQHGGP